MPLSSGTRIGPYEVISALGAGGMGEVYRARDTRLHRDVALKLLPAAVAADPQRVARFRREAQLLAALNHPNIAQVYGIEGDDGTPPAIAMELVHGRTLQEIIRNAPRVHGSSSRLPIADVVAMARQLASALEGAHECGIVHRDLKPANVKVRGDGVVKVLDFGLAKGDAGADGRAYVSEADTATVTSPAVTDVGVILGTAAYMAPEQARGRPVDKRADIWAFGAMVFEMLTGDRLFGAAHSVTETIAAVIKDDLQLDRLPADAPPALRTLVARCLERDPAERLRDIGEARILLSRPMTPAAPAARAAGGRPSPRSAIAAGGAAVLLTVTAAIAAWSWKPTPAPPPLRRLDLAVPNELRDVAISNDGTKLAYIATNNLYVRRLDETEPTNLGMVHVTARQLFWSPDDRSIGFTSASTIQTISADGGSPFVVARIPASGRAMSLVWLPGGAIAFPVWRDSLYAVPATGGTPTVLVPVDPQNEVDFHHVAAVPGDRLVVSTHSRKDDSDIVELIELAGARRRLTLSRDPDLRAVRYLEGAQGGLLVFARENTNAGIWSIAFEDAALDLSRATMLQPGAEDYRLAQDGTVLAMMAARERRALTWVDAAGAETRVPGDDVEGVDLELSPDGRRAVFVQGRLRTAGIEGAGSLVDGVVTVRDLETGVDTRLSIGSASTAWGDIGMPTWTPDGQRLIHRAGRVEGSSLVERRADIAGAARPLTPGMIGRLLPDGRTLIYTRDERGAGRLERAVIGADGALGPSQPVFPAALNVREFDVSDDGRLIAFAVRQPDSRLDVFLAELAGPREQWLVQEGGNRPRFAGSGERLFFARGAADAAGRPRQELVRVSIATSPRVTIGAPVVVWRDQGDGARVGSYDVAADGQRFLTWRAAVSRPGAGQRLVLIQNALTPAGSR
jgi:Tol biopolymer transport system component